MYYNFYFEVIKRILDRAIESYSCREQIPIQNIDKQIAEHIEKTRPEWLKPDPNINYANPLCRLGYIFAYAGANATLFEKTICRSRHLEALLREKAAGSINICAVGGGPGTELLGLTKYLLTKRIALREIKFTVLDIVHEWSEIWDYLAEESRDALNKNSSISLTIDKSFHPIDVVDPASYKSYAWLFEKANLMVFNYLISENKISLANFVGALSEMVRKAPIGCHFIVIDNLERKSAFRRNVKNALEKSGLNNSEEFEIGDKMSDNEAVLREYVQRFNNHPRQKFRRGEKDYPTVFAIVAQKV